MRLRDGAVIVVAGLIGAIVVACGKKQAPPPGGLDDFGDTGTNPGQDSTTDAGNDAGEDVAQDTGGEIYFPPPDFGPTPDSVAGDGPSIDPPPSGKDPLTFCTSDVRTFNSKSFPALPPTPPTFANAWNEEVKKAAGGVLLFELSGLKSDPLDAKLKIGTTDGSATPSFSTSLPPATLGVSIFASTRAVRLSQTKAVFKVKFATASTTAEIPVSAVQVDGRLNAACNGFETLGVRLFVPETAKGVAFAGSTVGDLMKEPSEIFEGTKGWIVVLGTPTDTE